MNFYNFVVYLSFLYIRLCKSILRINRLSIYLSALFQWIEKYKYNEKRVKESHSGIAERAAKENENHP